MRAAAMLLVLGLLVLGFARSASADDPRALAARLASPIFHDRDAATRQLIAVGVPAIPALEDVRRSGSPEAVRRATSALLAIRAAEDSRLAVAVKPVALNIRDRPLAAAVADLRERTGVNLALDLNAVADPTRRVTVRTGELPPWQAVEAFRAAAGLTEVFSPAPVSSVSPSLSDSRYPIRPAATARPADTPVVWRDGTDPAPPADASSGLRVLVARAATRDREGRQLVLTLDVTPTVGLNWQRTDEVRLGTAVTADGRRLEPVLRPDPIVQFHSGGYYSPLQSPGLPMVAAAPPPGNGRSFPVALSADRPVTALKVLEGVVCGDVHRAGQPLLEIDDLPAAVGKTFDGPLGSTLTVAAVTADVVQVRCTSVSPWSLRQSGAARSGEIADVAFNSTVPRRVRLYDADGRPVPTREGWLKAVGTSDRETVTFAVEVGRAAAGRAKPARLVVLGTKVVPVRVPFKLENVEVRE